MIKKNSFYIVLILIYLLFLMKDNFFIIKNNHNQIENYACHIENKNQEEEYQALLKINKLENSPFLVTYSKVINRGIYHFFDTITIDKGSKENLKKGDIIINENGLIGTITKTNKHTSEVTLITSDSTNLSVKIKESYGILYSKDHKLYVKNLKIEGTIKEGDEVVTSGLTQIPENITIGKVSKVGKDSLELEYIVEISQASMQKLKYVGVISV